MSPANAELPPLQKIDAEIAARAEELGALQRLRRVAKAAARVEEARRRRLAVQREGAECRPALSEPN
jgi:hypothetical protein